MADSGMPNSTAQPSLQLNLESMWNPQLSGHNCLKILHVRWWSGDKEAIPVVPLPCSLQPLQLWISHMQQGASANDGFNTVFQCTSYWFPSVAPGVYSLYADSFSLVPSWCQKMHQYIFWLNVAMLTSVSGWGFSLDHQTLTLVNISFISNLI